MKNASSKWIVVTAFAGALMGGAAWAGAMADGGCPGPERGGPGAHADWRGGPEDGYLRQMDNLNLTAEQKAKVQKILDEKKEARQARMKALRDGFAALRQATDGDEYDARKVRELADRQARLQADMMVEHAEIQHRLRAVLTPAQKQQLDEMKARGRERMERHWEERQPDGGQK